MHKILGLCIATTLLGACSKSPEVEEKPTVQISEAEIKRQKEISLLEDFSGVWDNDGHLITLFYDQGKISFIVDEQPITVRLGDIDSDNETVNLLVTKLDDYSDGIITLRRQWTENKQQFHLIYTSFDGQKGELGFVRRIGQDDKNRIATIYAQAASEQYEMIDQKPTLAEQLAQNQQQYEEANSAADDYAAAAEAAAAQAAAEAELATPPYEEQHSVEDAVAAAEEAAKAALQH